MSLEFRHSNFEFAFRCNHPVTLRIPIATNLSKKTHFTHPTPLHQLFFPMKTILDDKKKGEICGILAVGGTYAMAAKRVGCSRMTIWRAANRDPEFRKRMYRAQTRPEKTFLNTIS